MACLLKKKGLHSFKAKSVIRRQRIVHGGTKYLTPFCDDVAHKVLNAPSPDLYIKTYIKLFTNEALADILSENTTCQKICNALVELSHVRKLSVISEYHAPEGKSARSEHTHHAYFWFE